MLGYMETTAFDSMTPLPDMPDPWESTSQPSPRSAPPFHMTDMIEAEPAIAARILERHEALSSGAAELARIIRRTVRAGERVVVTGCGTSEHAALGVADILRDAVRTADVRPPGHAARHEPIAAQAFELSLDPPGGGLVIGISHEGGTAATNAALAAAREAGARTAIITVTGRSPGAALSDVVVETGELDQSWCHSIGYVSPMLAAVGVGALITGQAVDGDRVAAVLADGAADEAGAEAIAGYLGTANHLIVAIYIGICAYAFIHFYLEFEEIAIWRQGTYTRQDFIVGLLMFLLVMELSRLAHPSLFWINATLNPDKDPKEVEKLIYADLERLKKEPVSDIELEKVRMLVRRSGVEQLESTQGRASNLGESTVFYNDPNLVNTWPEKYLAVTKAKIQEVAKKYFVVSNRTVVTTVPKAAPEPAARGGK